MDHMIDMAMAVRRVRLIAATLGAASLAIVIGTAAGAIPRGTLPTLSNAIVATIPHLNAGISLVAIPIIGYGWWAIRNQKIRHHRFAMGTGFLLFAVFLNLYLYKVALEGPTEFTGPALIDTYLYLPLLAIHILLAIVCVPLLYYVLLLGLTQPVSTLPRTDHPYIGRIVVVLWLTSFALGLAVYTLLYQIY